MGSQAVRERRAIGLFFVVAYVVSWTAWTIVFTNDLSPLRDAGFYVYVAAVLAPHLSALLVSALEAGTAGVRGFYRVVFRPPSLSWILAAAAIPFAIYLTPYLIGVALRQTEGASVFHEAHRTLFLLVVGQTAVALGEEPGWRGFALGRLTDRLGVVSGAVLLGIAWAVWHLPLFLIPGTAQYGTAFLPFLTTLVAWSITVAYLVRQARGSAIPAMLFHASANLCDLTMWQPKSSLVALTPWLAAAAFSVWGLRDPRTKA